METKKNITLQGADDRLITMDLYWKDSEQRLPIIVFCHGFKGFKDWGHWEAIAAAFVEAGFCFVKFNFSHNGVTPDDLLNFADLEAFGQNNYTKELHDLQVVLDWIAGEDKRALTKQIPWNAQDITVIGHSRGGPIALLAAAKNEAVKRVVTWAGVHELNYAWVRDSFALKEWEEKGVYHILNGRTKQQMPIYYQMYEDYQAHLPEYSMAQLAKTFDKPYLIVQGDDDPAVPLAAAEYLHKKFENSTMHIIEGGNHVFGGSHPFEKETLPKESLELVEKTIAFID